MAKDFRVVARTRPRRDGVPQPGPAPEGTGYPALIVSGASTGDGTDFDYRAVAYDPDDGSIMDDTGVCDWTQSGDGTYNHASNGPDEAFALGVDLMPGQVYVAGRAWTGDFDYGTVRFFRLSGILDPGNADHLFPQFIFDGSAGEDDAVNALHVNLRESGAFRHPDVFIVGFTENSGEGTDIRTIKYHDEDLD